MFPPGRLGGARPNLGRNRTETLLPPSDARGDATPSITQIYHKLVMRTAQRRAATPTATAIAAPALAAPIVAAPLGSVVSY
mmetsp:Transcript_21293/g.42971  ORF Transcript_21293/g.42971 Transcript_21293/m.42971 type:complete len:81 (-) Transcript_21293:671-913(-)